MTSGHRRGWTTALMLASVLAPASARAQASMYSKLSLTTEQARLIFGFNRDATERILNSLESEGFLARTSHGAFRRPA